MHFLPHHGPFAFPLFNDDPMLVAASRNAPALERGAKGSGVALLQAALAAFGYRHLMPRTFRTGTADGGYGAETDAAVRAFQGDNMLRVDGDAGRHTLAAVDAMLAGLPKVNAAPAPAIPPRPPRNRHYELGRGDVTVTHDRRPVGRPNPNVSQELMDDVHGWLRRFAVAAWIKMPVASRHLSHYLSGSGADMPLDVGAMLRQSRAARNVYDGEIAQARAFAETLPPGTHAIRSRRAESSAFLPSWNENYYYGLGGYAYWGTAEVEVTGEGADARYSMRFRYCVCDFYNWDEGKSVDLPEWRPIKAGNAIWPRIHVSDRLMDELRRRGMAREFHIEGADARYYHWRRGDPALTFDFGGVRTPLDVDGPGMTPLH